MRKEIEALRDKLKQRVSDHTNQWRVNAGEIIASNDIAAELDKILAAHPEEAKPDHSRITTAALDTLNSRVLD